MHPCVRWRDKTRTLQRILLGGLFYALLAGCHPSTEPEPQNPLFREAAKSLGIDFHHHSGEDGQRRLQSILGAGAVVADLDGDRDLDLLLVQSHSGVGGSRLYRNLLIEQDSLSFEDITQQSGLNTQCYGSGATAADFDNDGDLDLYITCFDANELWINDGNAGFEEQAAAFGLDDARWTTAAAWLDIDNDGLLDLYIGNYLNYSEVNHKDCRGPGGVLDYCGPLAYDPTPDRLLRNTGQGFEDVTAPWGLAAGNHAPALGAVVGDFDQDGMTDLYIANDAWPNHLWLNREGRFQNDALLAGVAVNTDGQSEGSMGVDAGDYDGDGDDDLVMVHLADEKATLYAQQGHGLFVDRSMNSGLGPLTRGSTGFGAAWIDADMDSWLDLLIVNGRVRMPPESRPTTDPYAQRPLLLGNAGNGQLVDWSQRGGAAFSAAAMSRGAAFGDLDNDGDLDVVINNIDAAPWLLLGQADPQLAWLGVELFEHGRTAHGARAGLELSNGRTLWRRVRVDGSYASGNDPRLQFALGANANAVGLSIQWSDGTTAQLPAEQLKPGAYVQIHQAKLSPSP